MIRGFQVDLSRYKSIQEWDAQVGDIIIYHGWFTHWFGVISLVDKNNNTVGVVKAGLPILLVTLSGSKMDKSRRTLDIDDIRASSGGRFSIIKSVHNMMVWYV